MKKILILGPAVAGIFVSGCGGRMISNQAAALAPLSSATAMFVTRSDGKDADSLVTLQLLRRNAELGAELRIAGAEFDDDTTSGPMLLSVAGPFSPADIDDAQVRIRMTPDGRDDWNFDLRLTLTFADATSRSFLWSGLLLNNATPERTLALAPARLL